MPPNPAETAGPEELTYDVTGVPLTIFVGTRRTGPPP